MVPGYQAWSVTASEQPTTAYWNILGSNDAAFNTFLTNNNSITANMLATSTITLGVASATSDISAGTSDTLVLDVAVTIPAGGRNVKITFFAPALYIGAVSGWNTKIWSGAVGTGTILNQSSGFMSTTGTGNFAICQAVHTPAEGGLTYSASCSFSAGTGTVVNGAGEYAFILAEAI